MSAAPWQVLVELARWSRVAELNGELHMRVALALLELERWENELEIMAAALEDRSEAVTPTALGTTRAALDAEGVSEPRADSLAESSASPIDDGGSLTSPVDGGKP